MFELPPPPSRAGCRLSVYNDGPLLDRQAAPASGGIGLSNLRTRLKLLYGTDCELRSGESRYDRRSGVGVFSAPGECLMQANRSMAIRALHCR